MAAYDPTSGELRTHYAGFFDPGSGTSRWRSAGTPAVLEVRAHDVSFALEHGQRLCKLTFEQMAAAGGAVRAAFGSQYQRQYLALSRQFRPISSASRTRAGSKGVQQPPLALVAEDLRPTSTASGAPRAAPSGKSRR